MNISTFDFSGKRALIRVDFNVPLDEEGNVYDDTRIKMALPTINKILSADGSVILMSHLGRPKNGHEDKFSLKHIVNHLSEKLNIKVKFAHNCIGDEVTKIANQLKNGEVLLLENLRFHTEEKAGDKGFAKQLSQIADYYVNDAFGTAHRAHASTYAVAQKLPCFAGPVMVAELDALSAALNKPQRPVAAVVGGAKVSTKLAVLENLIEKVDILFLGGGMANTFLVAKGEDMGASLMERDLIGTAADILLKAKQSGCRIMLPEDGLAATAFSADVPYREIPNKDILATEMMLDIGPKAIDSYQQALKEVRTVLWNGPMGAFEVSPFDTATVTLAQMVAEATEAGRILSVAGGGDTVAALNHAGVAEKFSYVSLAGGAFLEYIEGKTLPGVAVLSA